MPPNPFVLSSYQSEEYEIIEFAATSASVLKVHSKTRLVAKTMLQNLAINLCNDILAVCQHRHCLSPCLGDLEHAIKKSYCSLSSGYGLLDTYWLEGEAEDTLSGDDDYEPGFSSDEDDDDDESIEAESSDEDEESEYEEDNEEDEDLEAEMNTRSSMRFPLLPCFERYLKKLPITIPIPFDQQTNETFLRFLLFHLSASFQSSGESLFTKMGYQPLGLLNTIYWLEEERESNEPVYSQYATQPSENLKLAKLVEIRQNLKGEFENTKNQISSLNSSVHSNSSSSFKHKEDEELLFDESFEESSSSAMQLSAEVNNISSSRKADEILPKDLRTSNENVKLLQSALKSEQEFRMHFMKKEQRMKLLIEKLHKLVSEESHDFSFMETNNEQTSMKQTKRS